jgi:hypothetical protein
MRTEQLHPDLDFYDWLQVRDVLGMVKRGELDVDEAAHWFLDYEPLSRRERRPTGEELQAIV